MITRGDVVSIPGAHSENFLWKHYREKYGFNPFRQSKYINGVYHKWMGIVIQKFSPVWEPIFPKILRLRDADIIEQISRAHYWYWLPDPPPDTQIPIDIRHMTAGLGMTIFGFAFAALVFAHERYKKKSEDDKVKKQRRIFDGQIKKNKAEMASKVNPA